LGNINIQVAGEGGVDTSQDTVTADTMLEGTTAHDASGEPITGTIPTYVGANPEIVRNSDIMILPTAKKYCANDITIQLAL
jgi:N-acetylglucosamine-6-phosphate deacetylase